MGLGSGPVDLRGGGAGKAVVVLAGDAGEGQQGDEQESGDILIHAPVVQGKLGMGSFWFYKRERLFGERRRRQEV